MNNAKNNQEVNGYDLTLLYSPKAAIVLYALWHNYDLHFSNDGRITNLEEFSSDEPFYGKIVQLYHEEETIYPDGYPEGTLELSTVYDKLKDIPREEFTFDFYKSAILKAYFHLRCRQEQILLVEALKDVGVKSVLDASGNNVSMLDVLDKDVSYTAYYPIYRSFRMQLARDIYERNDALFYTFNQETGEKNLPEGYYDAYLVNYLYILGDSQKYNIKDVLHTLWAEKRCRYVFLSVPLYDPHPEALENGHLMRVYYLNARAAHILVFDMKNTYNQVEYPGDKKVAYEQLSHNEGWLNADLYTEPEVLEGQVCVKLSDIAARELRRPVPSRSGGKYPTYHLSRSFAEVASPQFHPKSEEAPGKLWFGQHIHLGVSERKSDDYLYAAISRIEGRYRCNCNLTITPKDGMVTIEYLVWILMNDKRFARVFNLIDNPRILGEFKVAIVPEIEKQKEIVVEELEKLRDVVNSSGVYKVVIVNGSGLFTPEDMAQMEAWNLVVQANLSSVSGTNGLKEALPFAIKEGARVDAILFDASTDAKGTRLKGVQGAFKLGREKKIPVFVYSSIPLDDVRADLEEDDLKYCEKGHLFSAEGEFALKNYITAVRDALDRTLGAQLRQQYKSEFKAAEKVDELFDGTTAKDLEKFLSKPNEVLNEVRKSTEVLVKQIAKIISNGSGLEKVNTGLIIKLFLECRVEDGNEGRKDEYLLSGKIMEKTLATALVYMWQMLDGGSHGKEDESKNKLNVDEYIKRTGTTNIAMSVIRIYMEFLVWLASTEGKFDVVCDYRDSAYVTRYPKDCFGTVVRVSKDEYYVKTNSEYSKIHLGRRGLHEGQKVQVLAISPEKSRDFIRKYEWYAKDVSLVDESTGPSSLD